MIKPWIFEFMQAPNSATATATATSAGQVSTVFDKAFELWLDTERLGFEGIFFSEHHFGLSVQPVSPTC